MKGVLPAEPWFACSLMPYYVYVLLNPDGKTYVAQNATLSCPALGAV